MATDTLPTAAHLDWRTIFKTSDDTASDVVAALDEYFAPFAQPAFADADPAKEMNCICCGKPLTGMMSMFLGGGFEWGIAHGEGRCSSCHWPARAHHFIRDAQGEELATVRNLVLQYHPDFVSRREPA